MGAGSLALEFEFSRDRGTRCPAEAARSVEEGQVAEEEREKLGGRGLFRLLPARALAVFNLVRRSCISRPRAGRAGTEAGASRSGQPCLGEAKAVRA